MSHAYMIMAAQGLATEFMKTFAEFPPRQKSASFTIDDAVKVIHKVGGGG